MAGTKRTRAYLETKYDTGLVPTEQDYADLFASFLSLTDGADISTLTQKGSPVGSDTLIINDSADSNNPKKIPISSLPTGSGINNVVEDLTPQLGGQLDINGNSIGDGTLELLKFTETASAVNEITITNAATTNPPSIQSTGDDTNIDLLLDGKGTGSVKTNSSNLDINGNIIVSGTVNAGADIKIYEPSNDANPEIRLGATDAEELHIQAIYDPLSQTLNYILFQTDVSSATANKGLFRFNVDGLDIVDINDSGLSITGQATVTDEIYGITWNGSLEVPTKNAVYDKIATLPTSRTGIYREIFISSGAMISRATAGATASNSETNTNNINYDYYAFDSATEEGVNFQISLPAAWNNGTIKAKFYWNGAATASGTCVWGIRAVSLGNSDVLDSSFGTEVTVTDTLLTVGDLHISPATAEITVGGTPSTDNFIFFQIVAKTTGTISVDVHLLGVKLQYQESTTEPSAW